jgi:7-cyano-7-deazaguanine synthase in queuosine biosynthesis
MKAQSLLVMSGGLDSTVLAHELTSAKEPFRGMYIDIGYLPRRAERNAARAVAHQLEFALEIVDLSGIFEMVSGFVPIEQLGRGKLRSIAIWTITS